jgi:hypothetical protein
VVAIKVLNKGKAPLLKVTILYYNKKEETNNKLLSKEKNNTKDLEIPAMLLFSNHKKAYFTKFLEDRIILTARFRREGMKIIIW